MRKLKLFFAFMLMAVLSIGQMWATDYQLVTSTDDLEAGANYVIGSAASGSGVFMSTETSSNNRKQTAAITITDGKMTATASVLVLELGGSTGAWTFLTQNYTSTDGYLTSAATGKNNHCKVVATAEDCSYFTISFSSNAAVITSTGRNERNILRYNSSNNPPMFSCYTSGQNPVYLFKEVAAGPSEACATPTFSVEEGTFYDSSIEVELACTTTDAVIHYTLDGSTPTSSSATYSSAIEITATTTIKAIAIKDGLTDSDVASATYTKGESVTSNNINFEANNLAAYVNWNFSNIAIVSTAITAHGGTYYGNTDGKASASITSKAKVATPGVLTFYTSKESGNTTASSWIAQVSSNGSDWTNVETFDATTGNKGTWTERAADLSAYTNVYVRIAYSGSTAIRAIDDIELAKAADIAKPTISGDENFVTSTTVTLSQDDADAIYYTIDEAKKENPSVDTWTVYNSASKPSFSATTTIYAAAIKGGAWSPVAEKTFTQVEALQSLAALLEATTSTETGYNVVISDWVVTGAISNRAWISNAENTKGILLYKSGHGFTAGKKLNGVVIGTKAKLYQGYPELTSLLASEVTVSDAAEITPRETTLAAIVSGYNVEQGTLVKLENVTYAAGTGFSDGSNTVALSTQLYGATMIDGAKYNIIGVVRYDNNAAISIMPRSVDDVEQISGGSLPEVDGLAELKAETVGASYLVNLTDAVVTLVSGNNAFIEDATAGALIYYSGHGLAAGDKLNGQYEVTTASYNGKFEITAMTAQTGAEKTSGAEIPVTTLTIAQLKANFDANESKRIKIVGANVTDAISGSDRNGAISDGAALAVYAGVASTITLTADDNVDIIGYPGFHNTDQQLNVWRQEDITVNASEPPVVDTRKVAESPAAGFSSISGDLSGNEISFAAYQGGAATAPNGSNKDNELRLYKYQATTEYGGYLTITAKSGCTIDQVVITVSANCSVGWCKDAEELPTKESTPISVSTSSPFDTGTGLNASSVSVVNLHGSNQFKITSITVYYTGEAITLQSVAISGTASVLEYTEGQDFNPAGLVVTGHYSDNSDAVISEGITWTFDPSPLTVGTTSVNVTATVGSVTSSAFPVNGLTVNEAVTPPTPAGPENVVILATYGNKLYAMSNTQSSDKKSFLPVEVEEDGANIVVPNAEAKAAIQWTKTAVDDNFTFQDANDKYLRGASNGGDLTLDDEACNWTWDESSDYHCYATGDRSFIYRASTYNVFKNYKISNITGNNTEYAGVEVRVIAAENIVVTSKVDPELAYDPTSVELTVGDDFTPATLTYAEGFNGLAAVTYESSNLNLATVEGGVVSLVADATGTATITATFPGNTNYLAGSASYTITVNEPGDDLSGTWKSVTAVAAGQKIIIAGTYNSKTMAMGQQNSNNRAAVLSTLDGDILTPGATAKVFTLVDAGEGLFAIQASNGKYLYAAGTGDKNYLKEADDFEEVSAKWTITFDANGANVVASSSNRNTLRYNSTNNSELFSCYAAGSQRPINIYSTTEVIRDGLEAGKWGTICPSYEIQKPEGASFYTLTYADKNGDVPSAVYFDEIAENASLEAGKPYLFIADGAAIIGTKNGEVTSVLQNYNGFTGVLAEYRLYVDADDAAAHKYYIIKGNRVQLCGEGYFTVPAERAYIDMSTVPTQPVPQMAGRRRVCLTNAEAQIATGLDALNADEAPVKMIINGQLFILRGEKMYNANGQLVK